MSGDPPSNNKDRKRDSNSSAKKKNRKSLRASTTDESGTPLQTIPEVLQQEEEKDVNVSDEEWSEREDEDTEENELNEDLDAAVEESFIDIHNINENNIVECVVEQADALNNVYQLINELKNNVNDQFHRVAERLDSVDSNLASTIAQALIQASSIHNQQLNFSTPPTKSKEKNKDSGKQKKNKFNLMDTVAKSTRRTNWTETLGRGKTKKHLGRDDSSDDESSSQSRSDSTASEKSKEKTTKKKRAEHGNSGKQVHSKLNKSRLFQGLAVSEQAAAKTVVQVTRVEKECKIKITDFKLSNVARAMRDIVDFQEREGTLVKMSKVLSRSCKRHLINACGMTTHDIASLSMADVFEVIAAETKVLSVPNFYNELKDALAGVSLMDWALVSPKNHEAYYFQQLNLAEDFMQLFRVILKENKAVCPSIDEKKFGLIALFRSFHNSIYWSDTWSQMTRSYNNMQEFIEEYLELALQQYKISTAAKQIPYVKGADKSVDKVNNYYKSKRNITRDLNNYKSNSYDKAHTVSNIYYDYDSYSSDGGSNDTWKNANAVDSHKLASTRDEDSDGEDSISVASNESKEEETLKDDLAAFASHDSKPKLDKQNLPCLRKLLSGKCDNINCPYGHRTDILLKGADDMKTKLKAFTDTHQTSGNAPYRVINKEKYGKA